MIKEPLRPDVANADILLWQTGYRLLLALVAAIIAVGLRSAGVLKLSSVAYVTVGPDAVDRVLGLVAVTYVALVLGIRALVQRTRAAGRTLSLPCAAASSAGIQGGAAAAALPGRRSCCRGVSAGP